MRNETAPKVHGETRVDAGEARNEVALPCVNGFFGCVGPMYVGGRELILGAGLEHKGLEDLRALIVQNLKLGA